MLRSPLLSWLDEAILTCMICVFPLCSIALSTMGLQVEVHGTQSTDGHGVSDVHYNLTTELGRERLRSLCILWV